MALALNKFECFTEDLAEKVHNLGSDVLKLALTNSAPTAGMAQLSEITQIANGNGYTTGGTQATISASAQASGVYKLTLADVAFTGSGAGMAQFRYLVLYNDTSTNDKLIGWYDHASGLTLAAGDVYNADFDASAGALTIT